MITEKNTIKIRTEYTVEAKKEFFAPSRKTSNKLILGSLAFAVLFIVLIFIFYYYKETDLAGLMFGLFLFSLLITVFGAMLKHSIKKDLKKSMPRTILEYEFYNGGIAVKEEVEGELLYVSKYYNSSICKTLDGKRYMFLYVSSSIALVIDKSLLSPEEIATLKAIYFKEYTGDRIKLPDFKPGTPDFVQVEETTEEKLIQDQQ
jgi:hypothetical protein